MQELLNREFLDIAEERSYPLDEVATKQSDQGVEFPADILADIRLTLDPTLGQSVFVSSVVISDALINITLVATDSVQFSPSALTGQEKYGEDTYSDPNNSPYFNAAQDENFLEATSPTFTGGGGLPSIIPIAVATADIQAAKQGMPIRVEPLVDGVGGWVVFGRELSNHLGSTWAFSTLTQSAVARRGVHFLNFSKVNTVGKLGAGLGFDGMITLDGENGIEVTQADNTDVCLASSCSRDFDGTNSLVRDTITIGFGGDLLKERLSTYAGPCSVRPDSTTCFRGRPITSINGVKPVPPTRRGLSYPGGVIPSGIYDNTLFLVFPEDILPYVFAWHQNEDLSGPLNAGLILASEGISIQDVCPTPFAEVDDAGNIGGPSECCDEEGCDHDCEEGTGDPMTFRSTHEGSIDRPSRAHICLGTSTITLHEYNIQLDTVDRTHLYYTGTIDGDYVYAEDASDLSIGSVLYINGVRGTFYLTDGGVRLIHIPGFMRSRACVSRSITYVDSLGYDVHMTVGHQSIFITTAPSTTPPFIDPHTPVADIIPSSSTTTTSPSGYYCEKEYGRYTRTNYEMRIHPYPDPLNIGVNMYPFQLYYVDDALGVREHVITGNLSVVSGAGSTSDSTPKPVPRLDSGDLSFTFRGTEYTGSIYSNLESGGPC